MQEFNVFIVEELDRICERKKKKSCVSRLMRYNKEHRNK